MACAECNVQCACACVAGLDWTGQDSSSRSAATRQSGRARRDRRDAPSCSLCCSRWSACLQRESHAREDRLETGGRIVDSAVRPHIHRHRQAASCLKIQDPASARGRGRGCFISLPPVLALSIFKLAAMPAQCARVCEKPSHCLLLSSQVRQ